MTSVDDLVTWLGERSWANERALERWAKSQRPPMFRIEALSLIDRAVRARLVVETSVRVAGEPQRRWRLPGRPPAPALSPGADEPALEEPPASLLEETTPPPSPPSPPAAPAPITPEERLEALLSAEAWRTRAELAQLAGLEPEAAGVALMHLLDAGRVRWLKGRWAEP